uniref:Odorant receptor n=1 Tax=Lutzomyia longipalpis TaxID=7200 RepID=A0A240SXP5_LUTLO
MSPQLEEFNRAKPKVDFLIALLTMNVVSGPPNDRFFLQFLALSNRIYFFCLFIHLINTKFELNFNTLITFLSFGAVVGYGFRSFVGLIKREEFQQFLLNFENLYEEQEEDEELEQILKNHLVVSLKFFEFFNKWGIIFFCTGAVLCSIYFRFNEDYGLMYELPFIASDNVMWKNFLFILQGFFYVFLAITTILLDLGIFFLGLQVIAELNILSDYMKLLNEKIKAQPKFLRNIIRRHCSAIENLNILSGIISETAILQLFLAFVALCIGMMFLITYSTDIGNYIIIICGGSLGLPICVLGEIIKNKTDDLSDILYLTNWYEFSLKDQKMFLIVLGMAQREYGLKAAGMYDVNFYTFIQISKVAFSYCAVLYSLSQ